MNAFDVQALEVANRNTGAFAARWIDAAEVIERIREHHAWVPDLPSAPYCICGLVNCPDAAILANVPLVDVARMRELLPQGVEP